MPASFGHGITDRVDVQRLASKRDDRDLGLSEDVQVACEARPQVFGKVPRCRDDLATRVGIAPAISVSAWLRSVRAAIYSAPMWFMTAHAPAKIAPGREPAMDGLAYTPPVQSVIT